VCVYKCQTLVKRGTNSHTRTCSVRYETSGTKNTHPLCDRSACLVCQQQSHTNPQRLGQASQLNHNSLNSVTFPSDPVCIQNSVVLPYLFLLNVQCQFDWFSVIHSAGCVFTFVVMFLLKIPCGENQVFKGTLHPFAVSFV